MLSEIDGTKQQMTEKIDLIRTKIHQDLQETKRELRSDLDRSYQRIVEEHKLFQDHREDYCQTSFVQTTSHIQTLSLTQKKITFWIGYLVFVFINIVILSVLSL